MELITLETAKKVNQFFSNIKKDVRKRFKNMKLVQILEFPVLFLGAKPSDTPSFYNFMNFADFGLGTNQLLPIIFSLGIHRYLSKSEVFYIEKEDTFKISKTFYDGETYWKRDFHRGIVGVYFYYLWAEYEISLTDDMFEADWQQ